MEGLPTIFASPYLDYTSPGEGCCCGTGTQVTLNLTPAPLTFPNGDVITRADQAAVIIAKAQRQGFPIFQGS